MKNGYVFFECACHPMNFFLGLFGTRLLTKTADDAKVYSGDQVGGAIIIHNDHRKGMGTPVMFARVGRRLFFLRINSTKPVAFA